MPKADPGFAMIIVAYPENAVRETSNIQAILAIENALKGDKVPPQADKPIKNDASFALWIPN